MKCGHVAQGTNTKTNTPSCVICIGLTPDAEIVVSDLPDLTGRIARCYCGKETPSDFDLPFFEYNGEGSDRAVNQCKCGYYKVVHQYNGHYAPDKYGNPGKINPNWKCTGFESKGDSQDTYYCGCRGWD